MWIAAWRQYGPLHRVRATYRCMLACIPILCQSATSYELIVGVALTLTKNDLNIQQIIHGGVQMAYLVRTKQQSQ